MIFELEVITHLSEVITHLSVSVYSHKTKINKNRCSAKTEVNMHEIHLES